MPISVALSLLGALLGVSVFALGDFGERSTSNMILVATTAFNIVAILSLFWILFYHRNDTAAKFGKVARENISTIVVSLMIGLVFSGISLAQSFGMAVEGELAPAKSAGE